MKKVIIGVICAVLFIGVAASVYVLFIRNSGQTSEQQVETVEKQDFPVKAEDIDTIAELKQFTTSYNNISLSHPSNWSVTEGAENSQETQLYTIESPLDTNEFYFCLDLYIVDATVQEDFESTGIEVLAVDTIEGNLSSVIYKLEDSDTLYWNATEDTPQANDTTFTRQLTRQDAVRIQAFGRFNCRSTTPPEISISQFGESYWLQEAEKIIQTIEL